MYAKRAVLTVLFLVITLSLGIAAQGADSTRAQASDVINPLTIYAYDSFVSEWGPGPAVGEAFTAATGIEIRWVSVGDSGQVLQRAILEADRPQADIIIGVDNNLLARALESDILLPYDGIMLDSIDEELLFDPSNHIIPYDFGYFSFIVDSEKADAPYPKSLEDLTSPRFSRQLIIMDPRTSSPGLGLLLWSIAQFGDEYLSFWERLKPNILTITDGWDSGYGLFLEGEAPYVLSYTTSPAYHAEYETAGIYQAVLFSDGHYAQIEGAGILKGTKQLDNARAFLDFLLGERAQSIIPLTNWMYPVSSAVELPESYEYAEKPDTSLILPYDYIADNLDAILDAWTAVMSK